MKPVSFVSRVNDKDQPTFAEIYLIVERAICFCETYLKDYFLKERFLLVNQHMKLNNLTTYTQGFLSFSMLAYSRKIAQQEELQKDMLNVLKSLILESLNVTHDVYERRLSEEIVVWNDKQQLALSPNPLLRAQSEVIDTIFT